MSLRLDPRRLGTLKQLAAEAGVRPGDLVRQWVEERVDAARHGVATPEAAQDLATRLAALAERVAALEATTSPPPAEATPEAGATPDADATTPDDDSRPTESPAPKARRSSTKRVSAAPAGERVALHEEMIAVLAERGPMTAADLAVAVSRRGRYTPPRSGKQIDAAMISQRVSNPAYRARFTRNEGRIGLAESAV
ncbi:MAG TPA: hypothetical protein VF365_03275 [Candidatus Limnocylindria bacterium]